MLQQMIQISQQTTISMLEKTQAEARLQARRMEEESAKKYEAGYASSKNRRMASERAEKHAQGLKDRYEQLLRDQELHTTAVADQLTSHRMEQDNTKASEKYGLLQKQIDQLQSNFEMKLAEKDKRIQDLERLNRSTQEQLQQNQEKVSLSLQFVAEPEARANKGIEFLHKLG
jgi:hypothetical protein